MKKIVSILCGMLFCGSFFAQNKTISGQILEDENLLLLYGVNIFTTDGLYSTQTDWEGKFTIKIPSSYNSLKISSIDHESIEQHLNAETTFYYIYLTPKIMDEVNVKGKRLDRSIIETYNTQVINSGDLTKAACCNLSESFETNMAVDVSFSDAVSGAKKMRMLGLDSYYTQTLFENQSGIRGLAQSFGMLYVPGPFMNSISINKGAGSVTNGYEALTGQINFNYKEAENSERFFLNLFGTRHGQVELNTNFSHRFNEKLSTIALVHGSIYEMKQDFNKDGFQDMPLNERVVVSNKWKYDSKKIFESQWGFNYLYDERTAGQMHFKHGNHTENTNFYETENINRKYEVFAKTGFLFNNKIQSIGVQYQYFNHQHLAWYGNSYYKGTENFANLNFIFQTKMPKEHNSMKLGFSYLFDDYQEAFKALDLSRRESVPGIFAEYVYQDEDKLSVVAGLRGDFNNLHGFWLSPKVNVKYNFPKQYTLKFSVGKGYRTNNVITENIAALASSRHIQINEKMGYESAWNVGGSLMKKFHLGFQQGSIVVDYYRTDFTNRIVHDYEDVRLLQFYNLEGKSYANSFQVETKIEAGEGLELQLAYKFDDVKVNYISGLKRAPYIPRHKLLFTADYETPNKKWRMNVTAQLNGKSRLPSTEANPLAYQRENESKIFFNLNSQITAVVKKWEFYVGAENLTNFWQKNPIIANDDPFGRYFDASMIWGPLGGTRIYAGLRVTIPYNNKKNN
jgi:outer membrane receptor for ferrienterochelin and colicins